MPIYRNWAVGTNITERLKHLKGEMVLFWFYFLFALMQNYFTDNEDFLVAEQFISQLTINKA